VPSISVYVQVAMPRVVAHHFEAVAHVALSLAEHEQAPGEVECLAQLTTLDQPPRRGCPRVPGQAAEPTLAPTSFARTRVRAWRPRNSACRRRAMKRWRGHISAV
jgi:hypothetical protein